MQVNFKIIKFGSALYRQALAMRERILRKPLGLSFTAKELAAEKNHTHIVGLLENKLVAAAILVHEGLECKMSRVVVRETLTNRGIGTKMVNFCIDYANSKGFKSIYCYAREKAINLYKRSGFAGEGDYFEEENIWHLKMRLKLKEKSPSAQNSENESK